MIFKLFILIKYQPLFYDQPLRSKTNGLRNILNRLMRCLILATCRALKKTYWSPQVMAEME